MRRYSEQTKEVDLEAMVKEEEEEEEEELS
jgi:hypothetical protein